MPAITPADGRDPDREALDHVDVAVGALADRGERGDDHDRGEARAGRLALAVAEPEDQERDDDRAAADAEEPAEGPGRSADDGQLEEALGRRTRAGDTSSPL